jgi:colanic acid biosynthesis glycosyl transferase WcaI
VRIAYISQYFPPEVGAPAARVHEFAREWVRLGHHVTVLTAFAHHPTGVKAKPDRGVLTRRERLDGIDVVRSYVYATANKGIARRMLSYASFMGSAMAVGACRLGRPDVVIATSPQLLTAAAGYFLASVLRTPFIFEVRDLWPETILAIDAMEDNFVVRRLKGLSRFLYNHSDRIVTVGEGYRQQIHELYGIDLAKMDIIHNGIDTELFVPGSRDNAIRAEYGWGDRFVAMYLGTHGMCHGLSLVLDAAHELRHRPDILFAFVGEGAEKAELENRARDLGLRNVQFINQQPKHRVPGFYAACDVGLVTLRDTPLFQEVLPSKIFEYLGMERSIILSVDGEARRLVQAAGGGTFVPPGDVHALANAVVHAAENRTVLDQMGQSGRQYVLTHFDRAALARRYLDVIGDLCGSPWRVPAPSSREGLVSANEGVHTPSPAPRPRSHSIAKRKGTEVTA